MNIRNGIKTVLEKIRRICKRVVYKCDTIGEKIIRHINNIFFTKHIIISVKEVFCQNIGKGGFRRYDMIVRLLAVENYYGLNSCGMELYYRMQSRRNETINAQSAVDRFRKLIESYDKDGYDPHSEIELGKDLCLIDGSHRMAMAMYHRCPTISAKVRNYSLDVYYSLEWFAANDFTKEECEMMKSKYEEIAADYNQPFVCSLWHPAFPYFDEIERKLSLFGEVLESKTYSLNEYEYIYYTRGIYAVDDIEKWKIEKKVQHMVSSDTKEYHLRLILLLLSDPQFRLKQSTNGTLSAKCEKIKKIIRAVYKRRVENYYHDIVMHIGDNFFQNQFIYKLMNVPKIDLQQILVNLSEYEYVITKTDVDYMPQDFPVHYPLGKDIDIICNNMDNYDKVINSILQDVQSFKDIYDIRKVPKSPNRCQVRIELSGYPVFIFDVFSKIEFSKDNTTQELCDNRVLKNGYYTPNEKGEIIARLCELKMHPEKKHHQKYITDHKDNIDKDLCDKYLNFNWKKYVN